MPKWLRRMLFRKKQPRQKERWIKQTSLSILYRTTKIVGLRVHTNSRV